MTHENLSNSSNVQHSRAELLKLITEARANGNTGEVRRLTIWLYHAIGRHLCAEGQPPKQQAS